MANAEHRKLSVPAFAITCAILWGLALFLCTWWIIIFEGQQPADDLVIGRIYRGYTVSTVGSVIGLLWGAADGLIGGAIFAWLYNLIAGCSAPSSATTT